MLYKHQQLREEKVFKDPVHRYIHVSDRVIWDLIGTREFQRLRRIKQLGTTFLTFHGAEHSRLNHSLGVYEIVRRMVDNFSDKKGWRAEDRLLALAASLLHDLGHGPFSHSFEKVFGLDHEAFTDQIILGDTEVHTVLSKVDSDFPAEVAAVIKKTHPNQLIVSMISSQIDADRMDYLLRDAYYTGVSYGQFDLERILRVMRPVEDQVAVKTSGMHAVEDYIMSRYHMYWQVYFHPVSRSAEVILSRILHRVKMLYESDYPFKQTPTHFKSFFKGDIDLSTYIDLDETVVLYYFQAWQQEDDKILSDLCRRFVNRKLFKFIDCDAAFDEDKYPRLVELFNQVDIDPTYYLVKDSTSDLPYDFYRPGEITTRKPIMLLNRSGETVELSTQSNIVEAMSGKKREDHKLYYPRDLIEALPDEREEKQEIKAIFNCK